MSKNSNNPRRMIFACNGVTIAYDLYIGGVKRLNLRVRADGTVRLSIPTRCTAAERDAFLLRCAPRILQARERCGKTLQEEGNIPLEIPYWGSPLPLTLQRTDAVQRISCQTDQEEAPTRLTVFAPPNASDMAVLTAIDAWRKQQLQAQLSARHRTVVLPAFARLPGLTDRQRAFLDAPTAIRLRTMTSRWGSCNTATGALTFNLRLLDYPPNCLDYVMLHEFAHFIHPDHSSAFYGVMDRLMPGWRAVRERLKRLPII